MFEDGPGSIAHNFNSKRSSKQATSVSTINQSMQFDSNIRIKHNNFVSPSRGLHNATNSTSHFSYASNSTRSVATLGKKVLAHAVNSAF